LLTVGTAGPGCRSPREWLIHIRFEVRLGQAEQLTALALHGSLDGLLLSEGYEKAANTTVAAVLEEGDWLLLLGSAEPGAPLLAIPGGEQVLLRGSLAKAGEAWSLAVGSLDLLEAGAGGQFAIMGMPASGETFGEGAKRLDPRFDVYPNPGGPTISLRFAAAREGIQTAQVYDLQGRHVRDLVKSLSAGSGEGATALWDGCTDAGGAAAAGVYFARVRYTDGTVASRKFTLLR